MTATYGPCAHPECPFMVIRTDGGWFHVDTHGADLDHAATLVTAQPKPTAAEVMRTNADFDVWLAEHDAQVRADAITEVWDQARRAIADADHAHQQAVRAAEVQALRDAAEWIRGDMDEPWGMRAGNRLDDRADRIAAGKTP